MFTNINAGKDELLQLVLVGQPELRDMVRRPDLTQFAQRVAASFHLPAMDAATVRHYISHRLKVAGGRDRDLHAGGLRSWCTPRREAFRGWSTSCAISRCSTPIPRTNGR